jgi:thermostable 8-oxoguanine DNA glycosylase
MTLTQEELEKWVDRLQTRVVELSNQIATADNKAEEAKKLALSLGSRIFTLEKARQAQIKLNERFIEKKPEDIPVQRKSFLDFLKK